MQKRPRLKDVARLAGVSTATASAVVTNSLGANIRVSPETQQRVWDAVAQLGYVANPAARTLAGGRNRILGIFTYEPIFPFEQHDFFYPFLVGIEKVAETEGYHLLLFTNGNNQLGERSIYYEDTNTLYMADGSILLGLHEKKSELKRLYAEDYPFVYIGRRVVPGAEISYVGCDYQSVTTELTSRMLALGHRRLVFIGDPARFEESSDPLKRFEGGIDRENGFTEACQRAGAPIDENTILRMPASAITTEFMQVLINRGVTGALIEWDEQCYAALAALKALGLTVPTDFSIVMLGEPHRAWENPIDWTMFTMPREQMGIQAAKFLIRRLTSTVDEKPERILLPATIIDGMTIAPPPTQPTGGD